MKKRFIKMLAVVSAIVVCSVFSAGTCAFAASSPSKEAKAAVKWAVAKANDNTFTFGAGKAAHKAGCYFCKTKDENGDTVPWNRVKKGSAKYDKTYCSNTFLFSAYAHGGKVSSMLTACQAGHNGAWGKELKDYGFKKIGKPKYKNLKTGDIVFSGGECWMYVGKIKVGGKQYKKGSYVRAAQTSKPWGKDSIKVFKSGADKKYKKAKDVMRYTK